MELTGSIRAPRLDRRRKEAREELARQQGAPAYSGPGDGCPVWNRKCEPKETEENLHLTTVEKVDLSGLAYLKWMRTCGLEVGSFCLCVLCALNCPWCRRVVEV